MFRPSFGLRLFLYETLLGSVGMLAAMVVGLWPEPVWWNEVALYFAILSSVILVLIASLATSSVAMKIKSLREIHEVFSGADIGRFIRGSNYGWFFILSCCAGIVEEILFRGIMQYHLGLWWTSLIFGLLHALTPTYFIFAGLLSLFLGWVYTLSGQALMVPIIAHAAYDFAAFIFYRRRLLWRDSNSQI